MKRFCTFHRRDFRVLRSKAYPCAQGRYCANILASPAYRSRERCGRMSHIPRIMNFPSDRGDQGSRDATGHILLHVRSRHVIRQDVFDQTPYDGPSHRQAQRHRARSDRSCGQGDVPHVAGRGRQRRRARGVRALCRMQPVVGAAFSDENSALVSIADLVSDFDE